MNGIYSFSLLILFLLPGHLMGQQTAYSNTLNLDYEHVVLQQNGASWNLGRISYERAFENMTSLVTVRFADRFNTTASLAEFDLYYDWSNNAYTHFQIGTSLSRKNLFPNFKGRAILYHNISETVVAGSGFSYFAFDSGKVLICHTNLQWYVRDYLFLAQGFFQLRDGSVFGTGVVTARKYLTYPSYIYIKLALGQAPEGLRIREDVLDTYQSVLAMAGGNWQVSQQVMLLSSFKVRRMDYTGPSSRYRLGLRAGIRFRF